MSFEDKPLLVGSASLKANVIYNKHNASVFDANKSNLKNSQEVFAMLAEYILSM